MVEHQAERVPRRHAPVGPGRGAQARHQRHLAPGVRTAAEDGFAPGRRRAQRQVFSQALRGLGLDAGALCRRQVDVCAGAAPGVGGGAGVVADLVGEAAAVPAGLEAPLRMLHARADLDVVRCLRAQRDGGQREAVLVGIGQAVAVALSAVDLHTLGQGLHHTEFPAGQAVIQGGAAGVVGLVDRLPAQPCAQASVGADLGLVAHVDGAVALARVGAPGSRASPCLRVQTEHQGVTGAQPRARALRAQPGAVGSDVVDAAPTARDVVGHCVALATPEVERQPPAGGTGLDTQAGAGAVDASAVQRLLARRWVGEELGHRQLARQPGAQHVLRMLQRDPRALARPLATHRDGADGRVEVASVAVRQAPLA